MHPLFNSENYTSLSDEEIYAKIHDLNQKIIKSHRFGKTEMLEQLQMMRDSMTNYVSERKLMQDWEEYRNDKEKFKPVVTIEWPDPAERDGEVKKW